MIWMFVGECVYLKTFVKIDYEVLEICYCVHNVFVIDLFANGEL